MKAHYWGIFWEHSSPKLRVCSFEDSQRGDLQHLTPPNPNGPETRKPKPRNPQSQARMEDTPKVLGLPIGSMVVPFLGLRYRILNMNHKKELPWSLWVASERVSVRNVDHKSEVLFRVSTVRHRFKDYLYPFWELLLISAALQGHRRQDRP